MDSRSIKGLSFVNKTPYGYFLFSKSSFLNFCLISLSPSLPFSLSPSFLLRYFFFIGGEFRGFHLRFQDVARGGIRIVRRFVKLLNVYGV